MEQLMQLASAITGVAAAGAVVWGVLRRVKRITEGAKCQLRSDMLRTYYHHSAEKRLRQYEKENFVLCYQAYRALGGNSFIQQVYEEVKDWEVIT
ncbi:MAG: hypothetical protein E7446_01195 [Ruminococcaceae bacterium]|nr:hypothetical protein [Oscillospiraceae bacterium]